MIKVTLTFVSMFDNVFRSPELPDSAGFLSFTEKTAYQTELNVTEHSWYVEISRLVEVKTDFELMSFNAACGEVLQNR